VVNTFQEDLLYAHCRWSLSLKTKLW
jgi:hypothetical protein